LRVCLTDPTFQGIVDTFPGRQMRPSLPPGRKCGAVALTVMVVATRLVAQTSTGTVYGNVIDELGSPIPGATATLRGPAAPLTASADASGVFRFPRVAPGTYTLTVTMPGFATVARESVIVSVGQNTQVDIPMRLATMLESVTVTNATPLLETRKVETGRTFAGEQLTEIPTSRDVWALIQRIPGVQLDTVNVGGNASALVGGPGLTNKGSGNVVYQIEGATITDNTWGNPLGRQNAGATMYFDYSTLDNVEVATGGSILEQETSGVTINVVTKRGTNLLKGSARYLYASGNWQSNNTPQESVNLGVQTNSTRFIREYGAELGGPILKDRLWLWAAGSRQDISLDPTTYTATEFPYPQTTILEPWSAKLNAQISNANSAGLLYQRSDRIQNGTPALPDRPPETRGNFLIPTDFYKAEDANVFSSDLFGSILASYQNADVTYTPIGGVDRDIQYYDGSYHNTFHYGGGREPQRQANLQVSKFFNTGRINHELKASFNYRQQFPDSATGLPGSQNQGGSPNSNDLALLSRGVSRTFVMQFWAGTLGDTLTADNLTIAAGLRYDLQQLKNRPGSVRANPLFSDPCTNCGADGGSFPGLPEVKTHGATDWQIQFANWQPRVSATYALGDNKSTLLRASYARFADQLNAGLFAYTTGAMVTNGYYYYWTDLNHDHNVQPNEVLFNQPAGFYNGFDPAVLPANPNQIQPGLRTPVTSEVTAGIEHQFTNDLAVSGTFSYRNTSGLLEQIPIGTSLSTYELGGRATGMATASNGFTIHFDEPFYDLTLLTPPAGQTLENRPGATQRYYGVDVSVVKRISGNWMMQANVGWNSFRQYLTPQSIQNPNNLWDLGGQNDNGGLATGSSGKYNVFINGSWQFNINGLYQGPWGIAFGANFFGRQGYPNPYYVSVQTHDFVESSYLLLIDKVDTYRYANVYELDFRLQKTFQIGPVTVIPLAEIFNVTNANTVLSSEGFVGNYDGKSGVFGKNQYFNQIIEVQSPRIVRLGLQVNF
jgi:Carboxypeptidase regulatory-like domain